MLFVAQMPPGCPLSAHSGEGEDSQPLYSPPCLILLRFLALSIVLHYAIYVLVAYSVVPPALDCQPLVPYSALGTVLRKHLLNQWRIGKLSLYEVTARGRGSDHTGQWFSAQVRR